MKFCIFMKWYCVVGVVWCLAAAANCGVRSEWGHVAFEIVCTFICARGTRYWRNEIATLRAAPNRVKAGA